jgi:hypothetical protein
LKQTSPKVMEAIRQLTVNEAETLTRLPHAAQEIVVESLRETGLHSSQTPAAVRMAQEEVAQGVTLSKAVLVGRIERLRQVVKEQRSLVKLKRTHIAIGPRIYGEELLKDKKILAGLKAAGRMKDVKLFIEAWKE